MVIEDIPRKQGRTVLFGNVNRFLMDHIKKNDNLNEENFSSNDGE